MAWRCFDFMCTSCDHTFEASIFDNTNPPCKLCEKETKRLPSAPAVFTTIVATTPHSKKYKAGYIHSHADRPATKTQVQGASFKKD